MKHVAGWEMHGRLWELVGYKGEQQGDCGTFYVPICIKTYYFYLFYLYCLMVDWC